MLRAWDTVPAAIVEDPAYSSPLNERASGGRYVDPSVQQAGYFNSRPKQGAPTAGIQSSPSNSNGALYRGQKVKMPNLPFSRQTASSKTMARVPQSNAPVASNNSGYPQSRAAGQPVANRAVQQPARVANARPPQPIRQDYPPQPTARPNLAAPASRPNAASLAIPNTSAVSPWNQTQAVAHPTLPAAPTLKPTSTAPAAKPTGPLSTADRLVAEAHDLSNSAQCEEDYTHIIETCRRAPSQSGEPGDRTICKESDCVVAEPSRSNEGRGGPGQRSDSRF